MSSQQHPATSTVSREQQITILGAWLGEGMQSLLLLKEEEEDTIDLPTEVMILPQVFLTVHSLDLSHITQAAIQVLETYDEHSVSAMFSALLFQGEENDVVDSEVDEIPSRSDMRDMFTALLLHGGSNDDLASFGTDDAPSMSDAEIVNIIGMMPADVREGLGMFGDYRTAPLSDSSADTETEAGFRQLLMEMPPRFSEDLVQVFETWGNRDESRQAIENLFSGSVSRRLPVEIPAEEEYSVSAESPFECAICFRTRSTGASIAVLVSENACEHAFCVECARAHFEVQRVRTNPSCPLCRGLVFACTVKKLKVSGQNAGSDEE